MSAGDPRRGAPAIRANIVGVKLQIAAGDIVECHVPPYEEAFGIELLRPSVA